MKRVFWIMVFFLPGCHPGEIQLVKLEGKTMGTTYHISYVPSGNPDLNTSHGKVQADIDSLLAEFNRSVSTYIPSSVISRVNGPDTLIEVDAYFEKVFRKAREVSEKTNGAFDVTVMPLVNAWGFGYTDTLSMDSSTVDSLLQLVDYRKVNIAEHEGKYFIHKKDKRIQVDFSAIAKGYGVDLVGLLLEKRGIENYMVEIGGEVRVKGKKKSGAWRIGIEKAMDHTGTGNTGSQSIDLSSDEFKEVLALENTSLATSGNYRNFYYRSGKKISHEIDPGTGYPSQNNLLSVTVVAGDCMTADAYATAFMVMGMEKTISFLEKDTTLNAYLIYSGADGKMNSWHTGGLRKLIGEKP